MRYKLILLPLAAVSFCVFGRDLPTDGVQADLGAIEYPYARLAGKPVRLAPGARIFDQSGRVIPPNTFAGRAPVLYKLDTRGDVQEIWVLTSDEVAGLKNKKKSP